MATENGNSGVSCVCGGGGGGPVEPSPLTLSLLWIYHILGETPEDASVMRPRRVRFFLLYIVWDACGTRPKRVRCRFSLELIGDLGPDRRRIASQDRGGGRGRDSVDGETGLQMEFRDPRGPATQASRFREARLDPAAGAGRDEVCPPRRRLLVFLDLDDHVWRLQ
eukprot:gene21775-biopygen11695